MNPQPNSVPFRELPTTSLYLQDSLQAEGTWTDWGSCRTGPFSFRFGDRLMIVRYVTEDEIALARSIRDTGGRVIYLIDDDLEAIAADARMPEDYRSRIDAFLSGPWDELKPLIDEAVVSSPVLAEKLRRQGFGSVTVLDPHWPIRSDEILPNNAPLKIAWLCTRSHAADLESISGDLTRILSLRKDVTLTVFFGKNHPAWIRKLRRIENLKPLVWPDYRRWLSRQHFDVALYPLIDTEVNRSRSINKFLEHAVAGAASILSNNAPFADRLPSDACLFAGPEDWKDHLETLLADRGRIAEIANHARSCAREISEAARARQIEFWTDRLPILQETSDRPDRVRT